MSLSDVSPLGMGPNGLHSRAMPRARHPPDPLSALEGQLAALRLDDQRLAKSLEDAKEARRKLASRIRALESSLRLARSGGEPLEAEMHSGTIADAIESLLRRNRQMRVSELVQALQDAGKLLRTESAYSTLFKTLARDQRFEKVPGRRGYWQLR